MMTVMVMSMFMLGACDTLQNHGNKELIGAGSGAVLGGLLGSRIGDGNGQLWATGAGALLGTYLGSEIGKSLDRADKQYMSNAVQGAQSAPLGEPISWSNPDSGNSGDVTPTKDGYTDSGKYCREFLQKIYIDGKEESAYGVACQQPDGNWKIVNS